MKAVGIVGVGGMGGGLADRLLDQGWQVTLWNRSAKALDRFQGAENVQIAADPAEAAKVGLVASFVANDEALESVTTGPGGILGGLPEGGTHISMSSVSPDIITSLAAKHWPRAELVCAPVFGRPEAAAAGKLWVALSGSEAGCTAARPMLEAVSQSINHFGDEPETALKVKIAGNFLISSAIEAMSEAFAMLAGTGADPKAFHEMMSASVFGSVIHQNYGRIILDQAFQPPGFRLALGRKDVGLARGLAEKAGVDARFAEILWDRFSQAVEKGSGDDDWNAISREVWPRD